MSQTHLVSVVIPIYRVENYLDKCINSVLCQTYENLEIILVDDGSPDRCPQICDNYAKTDDRIKVIHKKNGGLSDARNTGLKSATGAYVVFIDSDDYVSEYYIEHLTNKLVETDADISCCNYYRVYENKNILAVKTNPKDSFSGLDAVRDIFTIGSTLEVMTWNKLYKRSLFVENRIEFPVGKLHEDNFTTYKLFHFASKVVFVNEPLYYYIQREDSIMGREFNLKRLDILEAAREARSFFDEKNIQIPDELQSMHTLVLLGLYNDYLVAATSDPEIDSRLLEELNAIGDLRKNKLVTLKHKTLITLARVDVRLYAALLKAHTSDGVLKMSRKQQKEKM